MVMAAEICSVGELNTRGVAARRNAINEILLTLSMLGYNEQTLA